jgi:hypothetical protein
MPKFNYAVAYTESWAWPFNLEYCREARTEANLQIYSDINGW